jgi:hypothetical protein
MTKILLTTALFFLLIIPLAFAEATILISPEQRAVWAQMKADYDINPLSPPTFGGQMYKRLKQNTECECRYADTGLMGAALYQITNDPTYVTHAWNSVTSNFLTRTPDQKGGNFGREYFIEYVIIYDWLYDGLAHAQRTTFLNHINEMATELNTGYDPDFPIIIADSDQIVGSYFGFALWYYLTKVYNPTIVNIWENRPWIGGVTPSGSNFDNARNAIYRYVTELAEGGEWPESSEYNQGTVTLLITGALGLKDLTGTDYFPEVTAFIPDLAKRQIMMGTNDLLNTIQWSDEEHPRNTIPGRLFYWERINMMLAGITKGTPIGPAMQDLVLDLVEKYPPYGDVDNALAQRWLYFFDPYAPRGDRTSLEKTWYASGVRMMLSRDGWGPDDSIFMAHYPTKYIVHHNVFYFSATFNFTGIRNGR